MSNSYCEDCLRTIGADRVELRDLWEEIGSPGLKKEEALRALELLHRVSHGRILAMLGERVARHYPTPKRYPGRLEGDGPLWWVCHATGGVSIRPVLAWFSGRRRRAPGLLDGHVLRPRGGSAHFVVDLDGSPWGLIPTTDGAWHCRGRNYDSLSVELVNACSLVRKQKKHGDGTEWRWWAGRYDLPYEPEASVPWRGADHWQPYQEAQLVTTARLVRLCLEALGRHRFDLSRFSTHSQWAARKLDCGPLFPLEALGEAALGEAPLQDYEWFSVLSRKQPPWRGWLAGDPSLPPAEEAITREELADIFSHVVFLDAEGAPKDVEESVSKPDPRELLRLVQEALTAQGFYSGEADGIHGRLTKQAVLAFQQKWNRQFLPGDPPMDKRRAGRLVLDGIPGPLTRAALFGQIEPSAS